MARPELTVVDCSAAPAIRTPTPAVGHDSCRNGCPTEPLLAELLVAVEALLRHTGCPVPRPPAPRTMREWLA